MKAFLILEDGTVFTGTSIGSTREIISEIVFNTSMTGYLEVLTDPSYAGQAVVMTYPLIGNYGITPDMESARPWPDGYIVRELSRMPSNFRCQGSIQDFLTKHDIPGIAGIDTRALTKILREKGTMNGMITVDENYDLDTIIPRLKAYTTGKVVEKVSCREKEVLKGNGPKVALLDLGAKRNIARSLNERGCQVTIYPALTSAEEILGDNPDGIMLSNGPGDPKECTSIIKEVLAEKDDYGKYYHLDIFIKNLSETPIVFQPDSVHSNLLTKKDDTLKLEVYTNEEYQKKIKRSQAWAMALYGISAGINAGTAGYSTSYSTSYSSNGYAYTTITNHYDANAAYQANVASTNQMLTLGQMMDNDRTIREQGYLKTTTIYPDEAIIGYMNIKRKKGKILIVNIPIGDYIYTFKWDVNRKK